MRELKKKTARKTAANRDLRRRPHSAQHPANMSAGVKRSNMRADLKPLGGSSVFIRRLVLANPNISISELRAECDKNSIHASDGTLSQVRADFRQSLYVIKEARLDALAHAIAGLKPRRLVEDRELF